MRIKKLQLVGFKSSMERTVLDLPAGITGVVGPNGCGKSNIVDAIRWALGEQSAQHLRGVIMEDVIFKGTERYGPLSYAEAILTLDNEEPLPAVAEERLNPGQGKAEPRGQASDGHEQGPEADEPSILEIIGDAPEIEITRRLHRSGESEYLINGRVCRLRDIKELFLGTGVGSKAYSIIEQGRVGQIVGAKPEDLRLFIEEAAGTTLYRSRKLAAERKIERTRNNLLRVGDIVTELERQARSLKRQVSGAVRYKELKEEEQTLDRRMSGERARRLADKTESLGHELGTARGFEGELRQGIDERERTRDQARQTQAEAEARGEQARKVHYETKASFGRVDEERRHLTSRVDELSGSLAELGQEMAGLDGRLEQAETEQGVAVKVSTDSAQELAEVSAAKERVEQELTRTAAELVTAETQAEELKTSVVELLADAAALENERGGLDAQLANLHARGERFDGEAKEIESLVERLVTESESANGRLAELAAELNSASGDKDSVGRRVGEVLEARSEAARSAVEAKESLGVLKSRYQSLSELHASFEGYTDGVRAFMSNGGRQRTGATAVVADIIDIEVGYERAVAAVLEDRLQHVVVPDADAGAAGAAYLRETGTGRASFIPSAPRPAKGGSVPDGYSLLSEHVEAREGYQAVVEALLADVVVAESLKQATAQWKRNGFRATFVTCDGDVIEPAGIITGGSGTPMDEGLLARKAELQGLSTDIHEARRLEQLSSDKLSALDGKAGKASRELENLDRRLHELTVARVGAEGELELAKRSLSGAEERAGAVTEELAGLERDRSELAVRIEEADRRLAGLGQKQAAVERGRREVEARLLASRSARERTAAELEALRVREAELRQAREAAELRKRSANNGLDELRGRRATLVTRTERDDAEAAKARARLESPELDIELLGQRAGRAETEFGQAESEVKAARESGRESEAAIAGMGRSLEDAREKRSGIELSLKETELERGVLDEGVRERLGVGVGDLLSAGLVTAEDLEALSAELDRVRERLRRLGTVNVGAIAELEDIEGRLAELTGQRDDLERSINALRSTIARLNRLSRTRFKETFESVNAIFKKTFPKLFSGGTASLTLSDEENLLESGVEIFAQPPGKRVDNLSALSGGEQALTAVSLIFSLFIHKPSPFCVLDEVDAPLDDANIGRFANMVGEMAARSQFIIITHNKRTMECCDRLYGVTMNEPGVSKIVSVDIERAAASV